MPKVRDWLRGSGFDDVGEFERWLAWLERETHERIEALPRKLRGPHWQLVETLLDHSDAHNVLIFEGGEPDVHYLNEHGLFVELPKRRIRLQEGVPSDCHGNAARIWRTDPERYSIMTGYALSADGLWRQHSWAMDNTDEVLVDEFERRKAYFGVELPPAVAEGFFKQHG